MDSSRVAVAVADPMTSRRHNNGLVLEDEPPRLRFAVGADPPKCTPEDFPGFIRSVNDALARHADVQSLEISLVFRTPFQHYIASAGQYLTAHPHAGLIKAEHVRAWLCYGMRRAVKSFVLEVPPPPPTTTTTTKKKKTTTKRTSGRKGRAAAVDKGSGMALALLGSAVAETMALTLGNATLALPVPAEAAFHALTDLLLSNARIDDADTRRLGELLSSPSCPRLRRLRLEHLLGVAELELRAGELEELTILGARDLWCLGVDAPRLRALRVTDCFELESERAEMAIAAPALEALACSNVCEMHGLQFDGAPSVREIRKLPLWTHGHADHVARNNATIWILTHCTAAHRLNLHLHVPDTMSEILLDAMGAVMVDYESILVEDVPQLPNITALTVNISTWKGHSYGASLAKLIAQCINLEYLSIDVNRDSQSICVDQACICNREHSWENQQMSLGRLQHLDISGFQGLDYEKRLVQLILACAPALEKMKLP